MRNIPEIPPEKLIIRKSFAMPFGGGSIFFVQLDALSYNKQLVMEKFRGDSIAFSRPSETSLIAVNLNETYVDEEIAELFVTTFVNVKKHIHKIVFVGLDNEDKRMFKRLLKKQRTDFAYDFINDYEKAKEWLVGERY